jgi:HSP20 family protein
VSDTHVRDERGERDARGANLTTVASGLPFFWFRKDVTMKTRNLAAVWRKKDPFMTAFFEHPFALLRRLTPDVERFFDGFPLPFSRAAMMDASWLPLVDVFERDRMFVARADLPGMTKDNVRVAVQDDTIFLQGERKSDYEADKDSIYRVERMYGTFFRAIPLPAGVDPDQVTATFTDGVLELTAPMPLAKTVSKGRTIEIQQARAGPRSRRSRPIPAADEKSRLGRAEPIKLRKGRREATDETPCRERQQERDRREWQREPLS